MPDPVTGIIGSAIGGGISSIAAGKAQAKGAKSAADASVQSTAMQIEAAERARKEAVAAAEKGNKTAQDAIIAGSESAAGHELEGLSGARDATLEGIDGAANATIAAALKNNDFFKEVLGQQEQDLGAWRDAGQRAIRYLDSGIQSGRFSMDDFQFTEDAGFKFRQAQGNKALERSQAARGNLLSGRGMADAMRFNQEFASNEYGAAWNRENTNRQQQFQNILAVSDRGQQAATNLAGHRDTMAQRVGAGNLLIGDAQARQAEGRGNALAQYAAGRGSVLSQRDTTQANARAQSALNVAAASQQGALNLGNVAGAAYGNQGNVLSQIALQKGQAQAQGILGLSQAAQGAGQNLLLWNMLGKGAV